MTKVTEVEGTGTLLKMGSEFLTRNQFEQHVSIVPGSMRAVSFNSSTNLVSLVDLSTHKHKKHQYNGFPSQTHLADFWDNTIDVSDQDIRSASLFSLKKLDKVVIKSNLMIVQHEKVVSVVFLHSKKRVTRKLDEFHDFYGFFVSQEFEKEGEDFYVLAGEENVVTVFNANENTGKLMRVKNILLNGRILDNTQDSEHFLHLLALTDGQILVYGRDWTLNGRIRMIWKQVSSSVFLSCDEVISGLSTGDIEHLSFIPMTSKSIQSRVYSWHEAPIDSIYVPIPELKEELSRNYGNPQEETTQNCQEEEKRRFPKVASTLKETSKVNTGRRWGSSGFFASLCQDGLLCIWKFQKQTPVSILSFTEKPKTIYIWFKRPKNSKQQLSPKATFAADRGKTTLFQSDQNTKHNGMSGNGRTNNENNRNNPSLKSLENNQKAFDPDFVGPLQFESLCVDVLGPEESNRVLYRINVSAGQRFKTVNLYKQKANASTLLLARQRYKNRIHKEKKTYLFGLNDSTASAMEALIKHRSFLTSFEDLLQTHLNQAIYGKEKNAECKTYELDLDYMLSKDKERINWGVQKKSNKQRAFLYDVVFKLMVLSDSKGNGENPKEKTSESNQKGTSSSGKKQKRKKKPGDLRRKEEKSRDKMNFILEYLSKHYKGPKDFESQCNATRSALLN